MRVPFSKLEHSIVAGIGLALLSGSLSAQAQQGADFRGARREQQGPWKNDLVLFTSGDGRTFEGGGSFVARAGVPCITYDAKARLIAVFQWFPFERPEAFDRVAFVVSEDHGRSWTKPEPIVVEGLPEGAQRPFDPTLVLLDSGEVRLYFTCTTPQRREPGIYSAISTDGKTYRFEPGLRFGVDGEKVVDPAVTKSGKTWHLFSPIFERQAGAAAGADRAGDRADDPQDAAGYHAISDDGVNFHRVDDVTVPTSGSWIGNVIVRGDEMWFYGSGGRGWIGRSKDGSTWVLENDELRVGGDPAPVRLADGSFLLIATGPPGGDVRRHPDPPPPPAAVPPRLRFERDSRELKPPRARGPRRVI